MLSPFENYNFQKLTDDFTFVECKDRTFEIHVLNFLKKNYLFLNNTRSLEIKKHREQEDVTNDDLFVNSTIGLVVGSRMFSKVTKVHNINGETYVKRMH